VHFVNAIASAVFCDRFFSFPVKRSYPERESPAIDRPFDRWANYPSKPELASDSPDRSGILPTLTGSIPEAGGPSLPLQP